MLTRKQKNKLASAIKKMKTKAFLPEDEKLFDKEHPSPGMHIHDEKNPFGMHRHKLSEAIDGAHVHSPQNPEGEHVHGEHAGQALIDGPHTHDNDGLGWHNHEENDKENFGQIPIEKPAQVLPETNPNTPKSE